MGHTAIYTQEESNGERRSNDGLDSRATQGCTRTPRGHHGDITRTQRHGMLRHEELKDFYTRDTVNKGTSFSRTSETRAEITLIIYTSYIVRTSIWYFIQIVFFGINFCIKSNYKYQLKTWWMSWMTPNQLCTLNSQIMGDRLAWTVSNFLRSEGSLLNLINVLQ